MSNVKTCAACSTRYAPDLDVCPHCGSSDLLTEGGATVGRLPLFVSLSCDCGRSWQLRLPTLLPGLVGIPSLFCASCGHGVQIPWPPVEDDMPKITKHGGPTNARGEESSPDSPVRAPLAGAEADQGHPTPAEDNEVVGDGSGEALPELDASAEDAQPLEVKYAGDPAQSVDYDGMSLAELRELANSRKVASYGTKAQIAERLREADAQ